MGSLCEQSALRVEEGAGVIEAFFDIGRIGSALQRCPHLLCDEGEAGDAETSTWTGSKAGGENVEKREAADVSAMVARPPPEVDPCAVSLASFSPQWQ